MGIAQEEWRAQLGGWRERLEGFELSSWADRIREQPWDEAFVFFKHEDGGAAPRLAARLAALFERLQSPADALQD